MYTLTKIWQKPHQLTTVTSNVLKVLLSFSVLIISAKIVVPLTPVPVTMQTFTVCLIALWLSRSLFLSTMFLYLSAGALGIPVFAGNVASMTMLLGPTGGYLIGFVFLGLICQTKVLLFLTPNKKVNLIITQLLAHIAMFSCGVLVLSIYVGFAQAIISGVIPFLIGDTAKILLLSQVGSRLIKK